MVLFGFSSCCIFDKLAHIVTTTAAQQNIKNSGGEIHLTNFLPSFRAKRDVYISYQRIRKCQGAHVMFWRTDAFLFESNTDCLKL